MFDTFSVPKTAVPRCAAPATPAPCVAWGRCCANYPLHVAVVLFGVQHSVQVVRLRQEAERLAQNQLAAGGMLVAERRQATAATYKAEPDSLQASLGYLLAWAELEQAVGRTPGF